MVRTTDQEMMATEKIVCHPQFQEEGACHTLWDHMGKYQGHSEDRRNEEKAWVRAFIVFCCVRNGQGWGSRLGRFKIG